MVIFGGGRFFFSPREGEKEIDGEQVGEEVGEELGMLSLSSESKTGAIISQRRDYCGKKMAEKRRKQRRKQRSSDKENEVQKTNKEGKKTPLQKRKKTHFFYLQISFSVDART